MKTRDNVTLLNYRHSGTGIECQDCGARFPRAAGDVMRGHRRRCPVAPREVPIPGVCWS